MCGCGVRNLSLTFKKYIYGFSLPRTLCTAHAASVACIGILVSKMWKKKCFGGQHQISDWMSLSPLKSKNFFDFDFPPFGFWAVKRPKIGSVGDLFEAKLGRLTKTILHILWEPLGKQVKFNFNFVIYHPPWKRLLIGTVLVNKGPQIYYRLKITSRVSKSPDKAAPFFNWDLSFSIIGFLWLHSLVLD